MPTPRTHVTAHISRLAADVVLATWARARFDANGAGGPLPQVEPRLRILAEALLALGFRFRIDGTAAYENAAGARLPEGIEGEICVAAAEFIASLVPIVAGRVAPPATPSEVRVGMENAFQSLSEFLHAAGHLGAGRPVRFGAQ